MFPIHYYLLFLLFLNKYHSFDHNSLLEEFKRGNYNFQLGQYFGILNNLMERKGIIQVQLIPGYDNCLGLLTSAKEAIVLKCHEKQDEASGCFKIITLTSIENDGLVSTHEENRVCVTELSKPFRHCVGLTTKDISTILLGCPIIPQSLFIVKYNGEPPKM